MPIRKILFWSHLVAGIIAGLAIVIMCFTGTALAFEKQLVAWSERDARLVTPPASTVRLTLEEMIRRVRESEPDARPGSITVATDPHAAVAFALGRDRTLYVNPYTGAVLTPASTGMHDFMHVMENWHRWLALSGDQRPIGKVVNGVANAAFLVLAVTGLYLWLPRNWTWRSVRAVAFFNPRLAGKARDFNWHNTIGFWSAPILVVLTLTALPMSFRWANALVYQLAGETPPVSPGPGGSAGPTMNLPQPPDGARPLSRDDLLAVVQKEFPSWEQITLRTSGAPNRPGPAAAPVPEPPRRGPQPLGVIVKLPAAWPRTATTTVTVNPFTGDIVRREAFSDQSTGRRWRIWTRFLHTGEALGLGGQLLAALASLGGCFLVYTGLALSWRRFFGKKAAPSV